MSNRQFRAKQPLRLSADPAVTAHAAGLRYVDTSLAGIRRKRCGTGFHYIGIDGRRITDGQVLARIRKLAIPPAWDSVWICPLPGGHLQATGRDARGRKQYRYHEQWRRVRDETKYDRMVAFGRALPKIRRQTARDLALPGIPRSKVLATIVQLLEMTLIRVGNEEYARENDSFGLTTMRDKHVVVQGPVLRFEFRGKSGIKHAVSITDPRLARIVKRSQDLPGYELFQYLDDAGTRRTVESADVNEYLRAIAGEGFTAKDFRTWAGTVLVMRALQHLPAFNSPAHAKRNVLRAVQAVAMRLGNTPTICRKCYVHPALLDAYFDGTLSNLNGRGKTSLPRKIRHLRGLGPEEVIVISLLEHRLATQTKAERRATA